MLRSLVGSEMCIRDRYQRRVHGACPSILSGEGLPSKLFRVKVNKGWRQFCSRCRDAFAKDQYCPFCCAIYFDGEAAVDLKQWVLCEGRDSQPCNRWVHVDCEEQAIQESLRNDTKYVYLCPICRGRKAQTKKGKKERKGKGHTMNWQAFRARNLRAKESDDNWQAKEQEEMNLLIFEGSLDVRETQDPEYLFPPEAFLRMQKPSYNGSRLRSKAFGNDISSFLDTILSAHGIRLQLSDMEVNTDLNYLRKMSTMPEEIERESYDTGRVSGERSRVLLGRPGISKRTKN
eukprot:TRINITY_DN2102_c0_g2_i4.p1 TRINITY_DN2102_c0_g2~~TRINITY_DN2102_c0_g2_i4.p1  ORF type:complete len:289 (+),score=73.63 TRINITY_DN2102_c0_g2_i4:50-916(+)